MSDTPVEPTPEQIAHDSDPDTDEDTHNHRFDAEGNVNDLDV